MAASQLIGLENLKKKYVGVCEMNIKNKAAFFAIGLSMTVFCGESQSMTVYDPTVAARAVEQIQVLKKQLSSMDQQINAIKGSRNMGSLLADQTRKVLPPEWNSAMTLLNESNSAYGQLTSSIQNIKDAQAVLSKADMNNLTPEMQRYLQNIRQISASQQALGQQAFNNSNKRIDTLQKLTDQINTATDPKAIWDLQARIQTEQAQLQNDQARIQSVAQLTQAQNIATQQMNNEMRVQTSGSGKFPSLSTSIR